MAAVKAPPAVLPALLRSSKTPLDPPFAAQAALDRQASNALASSSGRGQGVPAGEGSHTSSPKRRRRQLTSRKEHWAAKAAAAVVAEATRVSVSREPSKRRTLRRPPSLKLTPEQLEVCRVQTALTPCFSRTESLSTFVLNCSMS